ncbi:uncharacterized protein K02A2.6-like [Anopheles gambiae]|uniref:uncharacterized protein K02A2.6-like n=1 Tax=Anopheles gambiae TaxID=7165 RepID=UPI002AC970B2|nr:uncharacterized protein K02A2.6-like [Anopheles gambiae]
MLNSDDRNSDQQPSRSSHESHRQSSVPDPNTAWIHEMFKQQQSILHQQQEAFMKQQESFLTRMMSSMNVSEPNGPEFLVESLAKQVTEFRYDPEENVTFAAWYRWFEGLFEKDAAKLPDDTKVRLLLRKLGVAEHERYNSYILPQKASDFCFEETVVKLRALFGSKESCVSKRYKCYQMQKTSSEGYVTFSCRINKATEEAELAGLSIETQKCLIFVCGLKDEQDTDVRMKLLSRMEEKKDITLAQLTELCEKLTNLKRDTTLLAGESKVQMIGQEKCRSTKGKWQGSRKLHQRPEKQSRVQCFLCGEGHWARKCTFKHHKCSKYFKFGHKEGFCNAASRWTNRMRQNRNVRSVTVNTVRSGRGCVRVVINGTPLEMMLDTGADITIISRRLWHHVGKPVLKPSMVKARTASGDLLHILGEFAGSMIVAEQCMSCVIRVTTADLALIGKDAMDIFNLWDVPLTAVCNRVGLDEPCSAILQKEFPKLFSGKLGCCTKAKIQLELKEGAPVFRPKRPVAYAMFQAVDKELERLENDGIISKVDYSEWATPIVVVRKSNGTIRVCGDYSTGLNDMLQPHQYPLPLPQDIFASLATCTIFSQIDLSDVYTYTVYTVYTANRLQRYALTLLLYDFQLEYVPTDKFGNADVLSRLIAKHEKPEDDYVIASIEIEEDLRSVVNSVSKALPLKFSDVEHETKTDAQLRKVYEFTRNGWPHAAVRDRTLSNFHSRRESLSTFGDCLLFGERLIIPSSQRYKCLQQLHLGHPGIERMKALARSYVYWPGLDSEIESLVKSCRQCAMAAKSPVSSLPICWMKANAPCQRVHVDYAGPIEGDYFLLAIDSFSKWPEIIPTRTISSTATIRILRNIFARFGMPTVLVSDNGTQFTSADFAEFCNTNGVEHIRTAPFHPQSNGQAERFFDTFKRAFKKIREGGSSVSEALDTFLLTYRSTPSKLLEQKSPAELMFSRKIRTCLELLRPPQRLDPVSEGNPRKFKMNDLVYAKQYRRNNWRWVPGMISGRIGRVMYEVTIEQNRKIRSHVNQLQKQVDRNNTSKVTAQLDNTSNTSLPLNVLLDAWNMVEEVHYPDAYQTTSQHVEETAKDCTSSSSSSCPTSSSSSSSSSPSSSSSSSPSSSCPASPSSSSSPAPSSLSPAPSSSSPTSSSSSSQRSAKTFLSPTSPGFETADSGTPSPVQPLRRSSRVRRSPQWMAAYKRI